MTLSKPPQDAITSIMDLHTLKHFGSLQLEVFQENHTPPLFQ